MISVKNLTKHYGDFSLNVSLEIPKGRITGLVGKNGAGKSTVIKSILGLIRPDGGSVQVFGKDAWELTPEEKQQYRMSRPDSSTGRKASSKVKGVIWEVDTSARVRRAS